MRAWPSTFLHALPGSALPLRLYDTSTRELRAVATAPTARMYVCGITPYDATHMGHANTYLAFDLINRQWRDAGLAVNYVQNVTDVDDPLLERAARDGISWQQLALDQTDLFRDDMTALRVLPPDTYLGVTETIESVVAWIQKLIDVGAAYQVDDDWYFDVESNPRFGQVGRYDLATEVDLFAERGGDPKRAGKRHPLDCMLWRAAREGEPSWAAPIGPGRPGWHIECTAIALDHLRMSFDVQGGGVDLIFPHHEMSASQGQVATGDWPYARHYVHSGMVALNGQKMSKSRGNLVFVHKLLAKGVDPMAIRLTAMANHYRADWEWHDVDLEAAQVQLARWRAAVSPPTGPGAERALQHVREALANDLDTPAALRAIDEWCEEQRLRGGEDEHAPGIIARAADNLLGIAL